MINLSWTNILKSDAEGVRTLIREMLDTKPLWETADTDNFNIDVDRTHNRMKNYSITSYNIRIHDNSGLIFNAKKTVGGPKSPRGRFHIYVDKLDKLLLGEIKELRQILQ